MHLFLNISFDHCRWEQKNEADERPTENVTEPAENKIPSASIWVFVVSKVHITCKNMEVTVNTITTILFIYIAI